MTPPRCKRCNGSLYTREGLDGIETICLSCGYELVVVSQEVLAEYESSLGKSSLRASKPKFNIRDIV